MSCVCVCVCVCHFFTPSLLFIGGSHGQGECHLQLSLPEPTSTSNEEAPRGRVKAVGPTWPSADQGGRLTGLWGQPTFPFFCWAALWAHLSLVCVLIFVMSVPCSGGPFYPCVDMCRALICRNIVSRITPHRFCCKFS